MQNEIGKMPLIFPHSFSLYLTITSEVTIFLTGHFCAMSISPDALDRMWLAQNCLGSMSRQFAISGKQSGWNSVNRRLINGVSGHESAPSYRSLYGLNMRRKPVQISVNHFNLLAFPNL
jgi:hypothetical protein